LFRFAKSKINETIIQKNKLSIIIPGIDKSRLDNDERRLLERLKFEQEFNVFNLKLNNSDQCLYDQNPHLREIFINEKSLLIYDEEFNNKNRLLDLSSNKSTIKKLNPKEINTTEHWRQRKLLLSEIEFLTNSIKDENYLIIYAGAAPGTHLNYLSSLFPQVKFILIDRNEFVTNQTDNIKIESKEFTEDLAKKYSEKDKNILFICHIRTFTTYENLKRDIEKDISNLVIWQTIMNPCASLLTFRLPRSSGKTLFFEGDILLDTWSSRKSMECRLIVKKNAQMIDYDNMNFERAMNNFQNIPRITYYEHDFDTIETEGLDHCYDCRAEIFILEKYLIKIKMLTDKIELKTKIAELSYDISRNIYEKNRQPIINCVRTLNVISKK
jgi:cap2 methyltransferase